MTRKKTILPEVDVIDDIGVMYAIDQVRKGIGYNSFIEMISNLPLSISEWSNVLHTSERTIQRYKKENRSFDSLQSEKILQVTMLFKYGESVFGSGAGFYQWLETGSLALGGVKPKELLDSAFGIDLVRDELTRIEQGVLA